MPGISTGVYLYSRYLDLHRGFWLGRGPRARYVFNYAGRGAFYIPIIEWPDCPGSRTGSNTPIRE